MFAQELVFIFTFLIRRRSIRSMTPQDVLTIACCLEGHFNIQDMFKNFLAKDLPQVRAVFLFPPCSVSDRIKSLASPLAISGSKIHKSSGPGL